MARLASLLLLFVLPSTVLGHMAMTMVRNGAQQKSRSNAVVGDNYRFPNSPGSGRPCHGTSPGAAAHVLTIGETVFGLTTPGAGHGGGHCAWYISTDQENWFKINDLADCTSDSGGGQSHDFVVPSDVPVDCTDGCVLGWWWSPMLSGTCETYSNCWDVSIAGAPGGMKNRAVSIMASDASPLPCVRPNTATRFTPMFGTLAVDAPGAGAGPAPAPAPGPEAGLPDGVGLEDCVGTEFRYTVQAGDTLSGIADMFDSVDPDLAVSELYQLNRDTIGDDPNALEVGMVLRIPGGVCEAIGGGSSGSSSGGGVSAGGAAALFFVGAALGIAGCAAYVNKGSLANKYDAYNKGGAGESGAGPTPSGAEMSTKVAVPAV